MHSEKQLENIIQRRTLWKTPLRQWYYLTLATCTLLTKAADLDKHSENNIQKSIQRKALRTLLLTLAAAGGRLFAAWIYLITKTGRLYLVEFWISKCLWIPPIPARPRSTQAKRHLGSTKC